MLIESRQFSDASYLIYIMQNKSESEALDSWGKPDENVEFLDKDNFVRRFCETFKFSPFVTGVKFKDVKPFVAELRLSDGYIDWYFRVPIEKP
jgi:hypothetical protein